MLFVYLAFKKSKIIICLFFNDKKTWLTSQIKKHYWHKCICNKSLHKNVSVSLIKMLNKYHSFHWPEKSQSLAYVHEMVTVVKQLQYTNRQKLAVLIWLAQQIKQAIESESERKREKGASVLSWQRHSLCRRFIPVRAFKVSGHFSDKVTTANFGF